MEEADTLAALFGSKLSLQTPIHATPHDRRKSAVAQPESHPVSPTGSDGGNSSADVRNCGSSGSGTPSGKPAGSNTPSAIGGRYSPTSPPATSHFSIPAMRSGSLTPAMPLPPLLAPTATEERVTLNLFIDSGTPLASSSAAKHAATAAAEASEEACRLRAELDVLRAQAAAGEQRQQQEVEQLRAELAALLAQVAASAEQQTKAAAADKEAAQLRAEAVALRAAVTAAEAQQGAAAQATDEAARLRAEVEELRAQAAAEKQQAAVLAAANPEPPACVTVAIHVADVPAAMEQPAPAEPVHLVLNVVEQATYSTSVDTSTAAGAAALQQQLARAEARGEELARQAGQLKGRIAKVGSSPRL